MDAAFCNAAIRRASSRRSSAKYSLRFTTIRIQVYIIPSTRKIEEPICRKANDISIVFSEETQGEGVRRNRFDACLAHWAQ